MRGNQHLHLLPWIITTHREPEAQQSPSLPRLLSSTSTMDYTGPQLSFIGEEQEIGQPDNIEVQYTSDNHVQNNQIQHTGEGIQE